jgi:hypothetical protein
MHRGGSPLARSAFGVQLDAARGFCFVPRSDGLGFREIGGCLVVSRHKVDPRRATISTLEQFP